MVNARFSQPHASKKCLYLLNENSGKEKSTLLFDISLKANI